MDTLSSAMAVAAAAIIVLVIVLAAGHHTKTPVASRRPRPAPGQPKSISGFAGGRQAAGRPADSLQRLAHESSEKNCNEFAAAVAQGALLESTSGPVGAVAANALLDMSPARGAAGRAAWLAGDEAGADADVTGKVYASGSRLFGPGGLWTDPANRPRHTPLPYGQGPTVGPLTASSAGIPAEYRPDDTPLPPDSACGYVDLPTATTGGASLPGYDYPGPYSAARGGVRSCPDRFAARGGPKPLPRIIESVIRAPSRCDDHWSSSEGGVRLGGPTPTQLTVPDADPYSGWAEGGSGGLPMSWVPDSSSI